MRKLAHTPLPPISRDDDRLLNDYQRRIGQLAALMTILTIANEGDHDTLSCQDGSRVLSIAMDLAERCRDEYDGRLSHLVHAGAVAELAAASKRAVKPASRRGKAVRS
jgi:hypothetical protein